MTNLYKDAGVDVEAGETLVELLKRPIGKHPNVLDGVGGFAGVYELPQGYTNPVLVSCTDGVGTKLSLALELDMLDTIGQDLVAMCINDLICTGAKPLFFQDYFATSNLDINQAYAVIDSIIVACGDCGIPLIGGETAEMPGVYRDGEIDLAGFAVGVVDKSFLLQPSSVVAGDILIGISSSGFHSNGYSLINKLATNEYKYKNAGLLLEPTRLYDYFMEDVRPFVKAAANITGGGLQSNINRVIPKGLVAQLDDPHWNIPDIIMDFEREYNLTHGDMATVFNMGIGFVVVCDKNSVDGIMTIANSQSNYGWVIGDVRTIC